MTSAAFVEMAPGEFLIQESDELLLRQVTVNTWNEKERIPSSLAFGPATIDAGKPSFSRSSLTTPQAARDWHTANAKASSLGVWAVSVQEVADEELRSIDDSGTPLGNVVRSPAHCFVDYRHLQTKAGKPLERLIRSALLLRALARGEQPTY